MFSIARKYEEFLEKVTRVKPAHHAKIEEKPKVRIARGKYYTPKNKSRYI
jgi:hypothetical protein